MSPSPIGSVDPTGRRVQREMPIRKSTTIFWSVSAYSLIGSFHPHRKSGHHKFDLVGHPRDHLVQNAGGVAEAARQRIVGYDAEPDFIGNQHNRAFLTDQG